MASLNSRKKQHDWNQPTAESPAIQEGPHQGKTNLPGFDLSVTEAAKERVPNERGIFGHNDMSCTKVGSCLLEKKATSPRSDHAFAACAKEEGEPAELPANGEAKTCTPNPAERGSGRSGGAGLKNQRGRPPWKSMNLSEQHKRGDKIPQEGFGKAVVSFQKYRIEHKMKGRPEKRVNLNKNVGAPRLKARHVEEETSAC